MINNRQVSPNMSRKERKAAERYCRKHGFNVPMKKGAYGWEAKRWNRLVFENIEDAKMFIKLTGKKKECTDNCNYFCELHTDDVLPYASVWNPPDITGCTLEDFFYSTAKKLDKWGVRAIYGIIATIDHSGRYHNLSDAPYEFLKVSVGSFNANINGLFIPVDLNRIDKVTQQLFVAGPISLPSLTEVGDLEIRAPLHAPLLKKVNGVFSTHLPFDYSQITFGAGQIIHHDTQCVYALHYKDGMYRAGCRGPWTAEQALKHWRARAEPFSFVIRDEFQPYIAIHGAMTAPRYRAKCFIKAIEENEAKITAAKTV